MKKFFGEFKEFISKGNVLDMAVGIIIGGAFTAIVKGLVDYILSPILSIFTAGMNLESLKVTVYLPWIVDKVDPTAYATVADYEAALVEACPTFNFGLFIQAVVTFLITAFALFLIIKGINKARDLAPKKKVEEAAPTTKVCPFCKSEVDIEATKCKFCTSDLELEYKEEN